MVDREATLNIEQGNLFLGKPTYRSVSIQHALLHQQHEVFHNHIRTTGEPGGGGGGGAGAGGRLHYDSLRYIFNMDMPRMDRLAMMVDRRVSASCTCTQFRNWYASSGPHTAKLMIHHNDPISDLLSGEALETIRK